jgi:hypothetical protein
MNKNLTAIDTEYKGYYFRSRLEARYAVYLDALGWNYEYEPEGYKLNSGHYLPDFYFPDINCYAEVKAKELNELELRLCCELSESVFKDSVGINVVLFEGQPDYKTFRSIVNGAIFDDVIPIKKGNKYYPFYMSGSPDFDKKLFSEEGMALKKAREARFEFEWKSKY